MSLNTDIVERVRQQLEVTDGKCVCWDCIIKKSLLIAVEALEHYQAESSFMPCHECKNSDQVAMEALYRIRSLPLS